MMIEMIGRGRYSNVHRAIEIKTGKEFAIKIIDTEYLSKQEFDILYNEANIMEVMHHPNIIKFYEMSENDQSFKFRLEYVKGDDLYQYVIKNHPLSENFISKVMKNIL